MRVYILFISSILLISCSATISKKQMINGVSFVASREALVEEHINPLVNLNANYAAIMPFGFIKDLPINKERNFGFGIDYSIHPAAMVCIRQSSS